MLAELAEGRRNEMFDEDRFAAIRGSPVGRAASLDKDLDDRPGGWIRKSSSSLSMADEPFPLFITVCAGRGMFDFTGTAELELFSLVALSGNLVFRNV